VGDGKTSGDTAAGPEPVRAVSSIDVDRMQDELEAARAEIACLEAENERLRAGRVESTTTPAHRSQRAPKLFSLAEKAPVGVDRSSSPEEKVRLYRSLFAVRRTPRRLCTAVGEPLHG
jgi:hypothetical protein